MIPNHDVDSIQDTVLLKHRLCHLQVVGTHYRIDTTRHLGKNKYAQIWNPPGFTWKVETLDKKSIRTSVTCEGREEMTLTLINSRISTD